MRQNLTLLTALLLTAILEGCSKQSQQALTENSGPTDTLVTITVLRHVEDSTGTYAINIGFPEQNRANGLLANAVREWISEQLGGTYADTLTGDYATLLSDTAALCNHYFSHILKRNHDEFGEMLLYNPNAREWQIRYTDSVAIGKADEGRLWVTYNYTREVYSGGAHGSYLVAGQTFRKQDGRRIGWDILHDTYDEGFQKFLKAGLQKCWELPSEDKLEDILMGDASIFYIPLPQCPPLFTKDGILFVYNQYEIAAYAAGLPSFTVSYDDLRPFLNATARRLIGK